MQVFITKASRVINLILFKHKFRGILQLKEILCGDTIFKSATGRLQWKLILYLPDLVDRVFF